MNKEIPKKAKTPVNLLKFEGKILYYYYYFTDLRVDLHFFLTGKSEPFPPLPYNEVNSIEVNFIHQFNSFLYSANN